LLISEIFEMLKWGILLLAAPLRRDKRESESEGEEWQKPSTLPARLSTFLSGKIIGGKVIF
jgi:hypothetical protein